MSKKRQPTEMVDFHPTKQGRLFTCFWGIHKYVQVPYTGAFRIRMYRCERCGKGKQKMGLG